MINWRKFHGLPEPVWAEAPSDRIELQSARGYNSKRFEEMEPLPESLPLAKRYAGGLLVSDLRLVDLPRLVDFSAFAEAEQQVRRVSPPEKLAVWVIPDAALAAFGAADAGTELSIALYKLTTANRATPPAGDALVIVGLEAPDPAHVFLLKSLGMTLFHSRPHDPLPGLSVELSPGQWIVAMLDTAL